MSDISLNIEQSNSRLRKMFMVVQVSGEPVTPAPYSCDTHFAPRSVTEKSQ